jgi:hypothetical protein
MEAINAACRELTDEFRWLNDEQLRLLVALHRSPERALSMTESEKLLLSARAILGYGNGTEWYSVHPAITAMQRFRNMAESTDG